MRGLRLRTKFLLSVLAITAGLSAATLAVVRYGVERQVRASMQDELHNSIRTYQSFAGQREEALRRSAQLLANLPNVRALMTTNDIPTIQDASRNVWQLSGSDLLVLADRGGKLEALCDNSGFPREIAQAQLRESLRNAKSQDWWFGDGHLYQISIQPIYFGPTSRDNLSGLLAVGHEITGGTAADFATIVAGEVIFGYDGTLVASTVPGLSAGAKIQISGVRTRDNPGAATELEAGGRHYLSASVSLSADATRPVTFSVLKSLDQARAFMARLNRVLVLLGMLSFVAGGGLVFAISHTFTKPLSSLVAGVRAFEGNDFAYPLESNGGDEVAEVTGAFARMRASFEIAQREHQQLEERLRQAHKMEAVGRLAGGVAHDFNNLLTIIRGNSDLLEDRPGADDFQRRCVEQIQKASGRAVSMTRQLLAFSRMQVLAPRVLDLNAIVNEMGKMLPRLIGEDIEYSFAAEPALVPVLADPGQVEQVILNLAVNARDAMPNGGKLLVRTANITIDGAEAAQHPPMTAGKYVRLSVEDTGHGMDDETKARIFEPFFTTKEVGKGTGLGLATVYGIVKQSGGFIWLESKPGQGARFEIYLPQTTKSCAPSAEERSMPDFAGGSETILVVEDEAGVRELTCEFLNSGGYRVLQAHDGADAMEVAARYHGTIALLLTDVVMPRMGGRALAQRLRIGCPAMKVLFMSGYAEYSETPRDLPANAPRVLQKPFSRQQLLENVRTVLSESASESIAHARIGVTRIEGKP